MEITVEQIKELRTQTGAGVGAVKAALEHSKGDMKAAIQYLREQGVAKGAKRAGKQASNGILGTYIHNDSRLVVVVEIASETDFASKSPDMQKFAKDIALHIAATDPEYVTPEEIPAEIVDAEKAVFQKDVEGKPAEIAEKILQGKLEKFYAERVLLKQQLFSDESKKVEDYLNEVLAKIGEKVQITRFVRFKLGNPITFAEHKEQDTISE
ncbi:MAG: elongation factor Ts [Candidatus Doudnabacteria bacterium]|nr:elongation factor Ts [Candidatus Doudnabacteria bacterium]